MLTSITPTPGQVPSVLPCRILCLVPRRSLCPGKVAAADALLPAVCGACPAHALSHTARRAVSPTALSDSRQG